MRCLTISFVFALGFEQARRLGRDANGKTFTEVVNSLDERTQRELFAIPTDALEAAFNAGVARTEQYKAEQEKINAKEKAAKTTDKQSNETAEQTKNEKSKKKKRDKKKTALVIDESINTMQKDGKLTRAQRKDIEKIRILANSLDSITRQKRYVQPRHQRVSR